MGLLTKNTEPHESTEDGIHAVLAEHYASGASLNSILERDDTIGRTTFFRVKSEQPDLFLSLERKAGEMVSDQLSSTIDLNSLRDSAELQRAATQALQLGLAKLADIAQGNGWPDEREGKEGNINIYPRDVIEATRLLHSIAKDGIVPSSLQYARIVDKQRGPAVQDQPQLLPVTAAGRDFKSVKATTPDGTEISVSIDEPEVIKVIEPDD